MYILVKIANNSDKLIIEIAQKKNTTKIYENKNDNIHKSKAQEIRLYKNIIPEQNVLCNYS